MKKNTQPLSLLQREIMQLTHKQKYVDYTDILHQVYGFVPSQKGKLMFTNHRHLKKEMQAARVAISKSFNRLVSRGLVRRVHGEGGAWSSVSLIGKRG
jgi:predicted transcriptional regulator